MIVHCTYLPLVNQGRHIRTDTVVVEETLNGSKCNHSKLKKRKRKVNYDITIENNEHLRLDPTNTSELHA